MKKQFLLTCLITTVLSGMLAAQSPPNTEIYVFDFKIWMDQYSISNPTNVSSNPGFYDNQPYFTPNGDSFLYSSADETGKTDIYLYDFIGNEKRRITYTPEVSEYSPTVMPSKNEFSCIILEESGTQKLWKYFIDAPVASVVTDIDKVGYHAWISDSQLALFIVGEGNNTLQIANTNGGAAKTVASKIGPSIHKIPNENKVSFIDMSTRNAVIKSYDVASGAIEDIVPAIPNSKYFTWTPNGLLIMGDGEKLYKFDPENDKEWMELADLSAYGIKTFSRIAINDQVTKLAVVVEE